MATMTLTLKDLQERLSIMDEITVMELLDITSDQLVDRFEDVILRKADLLEKDLEEDNLFYEGEDSDEGTHDEETLDY